MVKKSCDRCGLQWGLAKRCCTCGNSLILMKKNRCKKPQKQCSATAPLKICSECGLQWSNSKRKCTCGHAMVSLPSTPMTTKRKRVRTFNCCSGCGLRLGKSHTCASKSVRKTPDRSAKKKTPKSCNDDDSSGELKGNVSRRADRPKRLFGCGVCSLHNAITSLTNMCTSSSKKNVHQIKLALQGVEDEARIQIEKITAAISQVKQLFLKTCDSTPTCAFARMRAGAINLSRKAVEKKKKVTPKPLNRSKSIVAGKREKQDAINEQLMGDIVSGSVTLVAPQTRAGRVVRPSAVSGRHKANRRLTTAKRGLLDAANGDGEVLVWVIQSLYQMEGIREAVDVAVLNESRTVCVVCACVSLIICFLSRNLCRVQPVRYYTYRLQLWVKPISHIILI